MNTTRALNDVRESKLSYLHSNTPSLCPRKPPRIVPLRFTEVHSGREKRNGSRVVPFQFTDVDFGRDKRNVYLRIKPKRNGKKEDSPYVVVDESTLKVIVRKDAISAKSRMDVQHQYKFTKILSAGTSQDNLFKEVCDSPISTFLHGGNSLLFAYGATNAGKTYTIQGTIEKPGIIPRTINKVFNSIEGKVSKEIKYKPDKASNVQWLEDDEVRREHEIKNTILHSGVERSFSKSYSRSTIISDDSLNTNSILSNVSSVVCPIFQDMRKNLSHSVVELNEEPNIEYSVWVSYAEIYNENIYDLLQPPTRFQKKPLLLGENDQKDVYIRGLTEVCVASGDEAFTVFLYGQHNLHTAPTNINHVSSRSHSIFSIKIIKYLRTDCPTFACLSNCSFVDLAGAERAKKTHNIGERLKESQSINTSLHVLGKCLEVLRQNQKLKEANLRMIPCRESKLTRIFQRALEGKDVFTMIVNINQDENLFDETVNVLKFSAVAMELEFMKPGKQNYCPLRSSRLSDFMMKSSIGYRTTLETLQESLKEEMRCADCMKLVADNENLRKVLEDEKKQIETKVRKELGDFFWKTVKEIDNTYREERKLAREAEADREEMLMTIYKKCYDHQTKRRKDFTDSDEDDDDVEITVSDYIDEIEALRRKVDSLTLLLDASNDDKIALVQFQTKFNEAQFELATVKRELEETKKIAHIAILHKEGNASPNEFEEQFGELRAIIVQKDDELKETNRLLTEACNLNAKLYKEHEEYELRNQEMEKTAIAKDEEIEDLQSKLSVCQKKLAEHSHLVTAKEQEESEIHIKYQTVCEARDEYKFKATQLESTVKRLEREIAQLKSRASNSCGSSPSEVRALEALVASHEDQLGRYKDTIKSQEELNKKLQDEITALKTEAAAANQEMYDKEIDLLQKEIKDAIQEKKELQKKLDIITSEHTACRENLKMTEAALAQEQKNTKDIGKIYEGEKDSLIRELEQIQERCAKFEQEKNALLQEFEQEKNSFLQEFRAVKLQNLEAEELVKMKEEEIEKFKSRRDAQFKSYEDMLKNEKGLREREQREVQRMQSVMRTTTPQKSEDLAEIKKLKQELKDAHMKIAELQKASKGIKSSTGTRGRPRSRKVQDENEPQERSVEELHTIPEIVVKPDPEGRQLRPRQRKKLYVSEEEVTPLDCNKVRATRHHI